MGMMFNQPFVNITLEQVQAFVFGVNVGEGNFHYLIQGQGPPV